MHNDRVLAVLLDEIDRLRALARPKVLASDILKAEDNCEIRRIKAAVLQGVHQIENGEQEKGIATITAVL